ncbi:Fcf1-domain-containing protein [Gonapodya prolifera JEL478]|uniref:U three protein 23 n=1 Tax=Gonapodya prolifera (strain JEL478) TaxID=1344416 RepID=A0A139ATT9_GONPJ|nr:Fcf1-domain-containing protein [Gonapodya prolifera JEL478]|eukprot:KXS20156.1 Fcf1-domain-containing protein [Gonapodya prolifera JEL478]
MKPKRAKIYKRHMSLYKSAFGFREPYQIIVDGTFAAIAHKCAIDLNALLPPILGGEIRLMHTPCTLTELRLLGPQLSPATASLRALERRHCPHAAQPLQASECIAQVVGDENKHRYCVATQDADLKRVLRNIPGVPLLYITNSAVMLEGPSSTSFEAAKKVELAKTLPQSHESTTLSTATAASSDTPVQPVHKRKRVKGPNPLSMKKKKKGEGKAGDKKKKKQTKPKEKEKSKPDAVTEGFE